jgi:hypothetical protein
MEDLLGEGGMGVVMRNAFPLWIYSGRRLPLPVILDRK